MIYAHTLLPWSSYFMNQKLILICLLLTGREVKCILMRRGTNVEKKPIPNNFYIFTKIMQKRDRKIAHTGICLRNLWKNNMTSIWFTLRRIMHEKKITVPMTYIFY